MYCRKLCYMHTYHQVITHNHTWQYTSHIWQLPGLKYVCISNSVHKYFSVQIHTQSVISVLKNIAGSTPADTYKELLLSVDAVMNLDTWALPAVAISVKTGGPPEGLPPQYFLDESGYHWYRCVLDWLWCLRNLLNQKLLLDLVSSYHCTNVCLSALYCT